MNETQNFGTRRRYKTGEGVFFVGYDIEHDTEIFPHKIVKVIKIGEVICDNGDEKISIKETSYHPTTGLKTDIIFRIPKDIDVDEEILKLRMNSQNNTEVDSKKPVELKRVKTDE